MQLVAAEVDVRCRRREVRTATAASDRGGPSDPWNHCRKAVGRSGLRPTLIREKSRQTCTCSTGALCGDLRTKERAAAVRSTAHLAQRVSKQMKSGGCRSEEHTS